MFDSSKNIFVDIKSFRSYHLTGLIVNKNGNLIFHDDENLIYEFDEYDDINFVDLEKIGKSIIPKKHCIKKFKQVYSNYLLITENNEFYVNQTKIKENVINFANFVELEQNHSVCITFGNKLLFLDIENYLNFKEISLFDKIDQIYSMDMLHPIFDNVFDDIETSLVTRIPKQSLHDYLIFGTDNFLIYMRVGDNQKILYKSWNELKYGSPLIIKTDFDVFYVYTSTNFLFKLSLIMNQVEESKIVYLGEIHDVMKLEIIHLKNYIFVICILKNGIILKFKDNLEFIEAIDYCELSSNDHIQAVETLHNQIHILTEATYRKVKFV